MKKIFFLLLTLSVWTLSSCRPQADRTFRTEQNDTIMENWKNVLQEKLPYLGHRNWIVITDMAYPLQTNPGIITLYATEPYEKVVANVTEMIQKAPHVFAHVYQDLEQQSITEELCPGWTDYKEKLSSAIDLTDIQYIPHEELIYKLDEVSKLYQTVIIKTGLSIPYTSTFFELDCKYWDADREKAIRDALK